MDPVCCPADDFLFCVQAKKHKPAAARIAEKTNFHGKHEIDPITKRSWIEPPKEKRKENEYCYLPKKHIHTWSGHTKGVNAIRQALPLYLSPELRPWSDKQMGGCHQADPPPEL